MDRVKKAIKAFPEKFGEAWLPCMVFMVEGDISKLTWYHAKIAYNTGIGCAVTYAICCLFLKRINAVNSALLTAFLTFIADVTNHPTHFGAWWFEAFCTGISAGILSLIFHLIRGRLTTE